MSKKIVVIIGSPRKNGNSFAMTEAFIKAVEEKGHTVTRFDAALKKVGGCRACETCFSTGKACTFDDDFNTIAPAILEADALVFTMPVYWYSMSVMDGVRIPMERMCALNKWKMVGEVLIPGVLNVGDIDKTDGCKKAAALADEI